MLHRLKGSSILDPGSGSRIEAVHGKRGHHIHQATTLETLSRDREPSRYTLRGISASVLQNTPLWLNGPAWLYLRDGPDDDDVHASEVSVPDDCLCEMIAVRLHSLLSLLEAIRRGHLA